MWGGGHSSAHDSREEPSCSRTLSWHLCPGNKEAEEAGQHPQPVSRGKLPDTLPLLEPSRAHAYHPSNNRTTERLSQGLLEGLASCADFCSCTFGRNDSTLVIAKWQAQGLRALSHSPGSCLPLPQLCEGWNSSPCWPDEEAED